jgi:circadian clock protein KaiC
MMTDPYSQEIERVPSGIAGLDFILRGGFLKGGVYIVQGVPGTGKTILANQTCFSHARQGGRAVYVTLLAESHTRMLQHLRTMSFYEEGVIPDSLYYVSAFRNLEEEGLKGLLDLLRREIRGHRASLIVLDGLVAAEESAPSDREFKKFIHEVQSNAALSDCTVLLLTSGGTHMVSPEHTMVDGLIELDDLMFDLRTERSLRVRKFRGSGFLRGRHSFRITADGIDLFPRMEVAYAVPSGPTGTPDPDLRLSTGIPGLDEKLGGGIPAGTSTALVGPSGGGKTVIGLHFLSCSSREEPGLLFGFFETPDRLHSKAKSIGIDLEGMERRGEVEVIWQLQGENILDELAHNLLQAVRRRGVRRLLVDGLAGFIEATVHPERMSRFMSALANELRALGVTTIYTIEARDLVGSDIQMPFGGISSVVENMIAIRYVEIEARLRRIISISKVRNSDFDPTLQEFCIKGRDVRLLGPVYGIDDVPSGHSWSSRSGMPVPNQETKRNPREE